MAYAIELTRRAERDLDDLYKFISRDRSAVAHRWFNGLERAILGLERFPRRCQRAPESRKARRPLRHLLYGTKPDIYRVLYAIDDTNKLVRVLTIRHGARDTLIAREMAKKGS
jgi:toxin ParE1/3/4